MSIWTFSRTLAALAFGAVLSGCLEVPDLATPKFGVSLRTAPQTIAVANRSVMIGGPSGYCVDRTVSKLGGDSAFVVLASCSSITRDPSLSPPGAYGLLTASVAKEAGGGTGLLADPEVLERFLASQAARAALARDARAGSVTILDLVRQEDAMMIRLRDTSQSELVGVDDVYWRGLTDVNGRLITIAVVSFAERPLGAEVGLATLRAFLARIRAETSAQVAES